MGNFADAIKMHKRAEAIRLAKFGPNHVTLGYTYNNIVC